MDRIRAMSIEELAKFLTQSGAETPLDFCEGCENYKGGSHDCRECRYSDDEAAWNAWLERETPEEAESLERPYAAIIYELYGIPTEKHDKIYGTNLAEVEKAIGFRLYRWQKDFISSGGTEFRRIGKTTAEHLRILLPTKGEQKVVVFRRGTDSAHTFRYELQQLKELQERLTAAGIPVNRVKIIFRETHSIREEYL